MSGHVGDLSEQQSLALQKLKENVKDVLKDHHDDSYMLRWLRAREFDVPKAEVMFRQSLVWRREIGVDTILETYTPKEVITKYKTNGLLPETDKHGCPIYIDAYGLQDVAGFLKCCSKQELVKDFVHIVEDGAKRCVDTTQKRGKQVEQILLIIDLKGFGFRHLSRQGVDLFLAMANIAESQYPEIVRKVIVINSPKLFPIVWKLITPVIAEKTAKKVVALADNFENYLLKEVDPENLPVHYGGTLTGPDGDPRCSAWIGSGGTIPAHYFKQSSSRDGMLTAVVGRGSTIQLEYQVEQPNSYIRYEFCSDSCDVGFGVFKKTSDKRQNAGEMDAVLTSGRVNSHMVPEDGHVECLEPGTYVVRFDNTYSWIRSKTVHYFVEVLEPDNCQSVLQEAL